MYVAPMYGYKSTKWLASITLTADVVPGYWEKTASGWVWRPAHWT